MKNEKCRFILFAFARNRPGILIVYFRRKLLGRIVIIPSCVAAPGAFSHILCVFPGICPIVRCISSSIPCVAVSIMIHCLVTQKLHLHYSCGTLFHTHFLLALLTITIKFYFVIYHLKPAGIPNILFQRFQQIAGKRKNPATRKAY